VNTETIFREAAINARQTKWLGDIVLIRPLSFAFLTAIPVLISACIIIFGIIGSYTKHATVPGQIVPDTGLLKVYASQAGVITQKFVSEGQQVARGDILFELTSERHNEGDEGVQARISDQVELKRQSLIDEHEQTIHAQKGERQALEAKIDGLRSELDKIGKEIELQKSRVSLAEDGAARYETLLKQDYVSQEQAQQKQGELLDQRSRLQSLERDQVQITREIRTQQAEYVDTEFKQSNQLSQINRSLLSTEQELTESEAKRHLSITASEAGIVTGINANVGQNVDVSHPIASIVPSSAVLQAQLYAPSSAVGFIRPGDVVLLRYRAYPYQKFGHAKGTVHTVSRATLGTNEINGSGGNADNTTSEQLYRITVDLASQTVMAYGQLQPLQAGMQLDADVLLDTRRLYEWVLEPIYSVTGKI
jgi:membrane fusion protein